MLKSPAEIKDEIRLILSRRQFRAGLGVALLSALAFYVHSDTMKLSTYYPAPAGVYKKLITTQNTVLARDGSFVGIGTTNAGTGSGAEAMVKLNVVGGVIQAPGYVITTLASAAVPGLRFASNTNSGIFAPTTNSLGWSTVGVERMRIDPAGNVGIGTANPTARLEVAGRVRIVDGLQGAGKVLTSDASGLASWQPAAGGGGPGAIDFTVVQKRVTGTCPEGQAMRVINQDGTVTCGAAGGGVTEAGICYTANMKFSAGAICYAGPVAKCVGGTAFSPILNLDKYESYQCTNRGWVRTVPPNDACTQNPALPRCS